MTRKKPLAIAAIILCAITIGILSVNQIKTINQKPLDKIEDAPQNAAHSTATTGDAVEAIGLGETIDMSGRTVVKGIMPDGVTYRFDNPRIVSEEDIMSRHENWIPHYDSAIQKYDDPLYLQISLTVTNMSSQDIRPAWFTLEAGPWSTVVNPDTTYLENGIDDNGDFIIARGQEKTITVSYRLWEPTFPKDQWGHMRDLPYQLAYLDHPEKYVIPLSRR